MKITGSFVLLLFSLLPTYGFAKAKTCSQLFNKAKFKIDLGGSSNRANDNSIPYENLALDREGNVRNSQGNVIRSKTSLNGSAEVSRNEDSAIESTKPAVDSGIRETRESRSLLDPREVMDRGENVLERRGAVEDSQEVIVNQNETKIFNAKIEAQGNLTTVRILKIIKRVVKEADRVALALLKDGGFEEVPVEGGTYNETKISEKNFSINSATAIRATPVNGLFVVGTQDGTIKLIHFDDVRNPAEPAYYADISPFTKQSRVEAILGAASGSNPRFRGVYNNQNSIKNIRVRVTPSKEMIERYAGMTFEVEVTREDGSIEVIDPNSVLEARMTLTPYLESNIVFGSGRLN